MLQDRPILIDNRFQGQRGRLSAIRETPIFKPGNPKKRRLMDEECKIVEGSTLPYTSSRSTL
jgi:hypothetical protein